MKVFVCLSRYSYDQAAPIIEALKAAGHEVTTPNNYEDPGMENRTKEEDPAGYPAWKRGMLEAQAKKVAANDAVLVLNFDKNGQKHYLGGATFLEVFKAWELGKRIFFFNPLPDGMLHDELVGMGPVVIDGDLSRIN